ncbi:MAG: hypothetical protein KC609_24520, partial [Myxococcales bacterium]|nr:hypothetical protein [Myxococcales bacterium]
LHGAADAALHGAADAALHGAADAALHGAADAALHGGVDGVAHGAADGAADGVAHDGADADGSNGLLDFLGLKGIPVTIVISVLTFFAWILSFFGAKYLMSWTDHALLRFAIGTGIFGLSLFASLVATSFVVRPLRAVFSDTGQTFGGHNLLGRTVTVMTLRVDGKFGQARWAEGGHDMLLFVRCAEANQLTKGSKAMVIDYDPEKRTYQIVPLEEAYGELPAPSPPTQKSQIGSSEQDASSVAGASDESKRH